MQPTAAVDLDGDGQVELLFDGFSGPRQTPFPVLTIPYPLPHFFPHLDVAERGAP
jgi:hypothetical protein